MSTITSTSDATGGLNGDFKGGLTPASTGPRTEQGKAQSSRNSVKHGLSGAGKVLPKDLATLVEERAAEFRRRFEPGDAYCEFLVGQLALASARVERCQGMEAEMTAHFLSHAGAYAESDGRVESALLMDRLKHNPPRVRGELLRSRHGRERVDRALSNLAHGLKGGRCLWQDQDLDRALDLMGVARVDRHLEPEAAWFAARVGVARNQVAPAEGRRQAVEELLGRIERERAEVAAVRESRQEAEKVEQVLREEGRWLDNREELVKLRRYEAAANRLFFKTLALLEAERCRQERAPGVSEPAVADEGPRGSGEHSEVAASGGRSPVNAASVNFVPTLERRAARPVKLDGLRGQRLLEAAFPEREEPVVGRPQLLGSLSRAARGRSRGSAARANRG